MKLPLLLVASLALTTSLHSRGADVRLTGCPDPVAIATALTKLCQSNWRDVTVTRVQAIWPTELLGMDCDSTACSSVGSKGRIINGHYECSEAFYFDVKRNKDGSRTEELQNIIIHYSAHQRKEIVAAARTLARASGLSEAEVATIGQDLHQDFHWENQKEELSGLNVEFSHRGAVWTLNLNFSRFPK